MERDWRGCTLVHVFCLVVFVKYTNTPTNYDTVGMTFRVFPSSVDGHIALLKDEEISVGLCSQDQVRQIFHGNQCQALERICEHTAELYIYQRFHLRFVSS